MIEYFDDYLIFPVSLFAISNPFGVIPIFISLTSSHNGRTAAGFPCVLL
ncbi:MAG: hypothetical protein GY850_10495 [bacterium]|nr:hypothetical protein [bacterium]